MSKIDHSLFNANQDALHEAYGECPECESGLRIRRGKSGPFIGCSQYPQCDYTKPLRDSEDTLIKVIDGANCPLCEGGLAIKKGRYGLFIGCTEFPTCHHIASLKQQEQDATRSGTIACPSCQSGHLTSRTNKFGKTFHACDNYPKCKYALNLTPVDHTCPACCWGIMQEKKGSNGQEWQCPQKHCLHTTPAKP